MTLQHFYPHPQNLFFQHCKISVKKNLKDLVCVQINIKHCYHYQYFFFFYHVYGTQSWKTFYFLLTCKLHLQCKRDNSWKKKSKKKMMHVSKWNLIQCVLINIISKIYNQNFYRKYYTHYCFTLDMYILRNAGWVVLVPPNQTQSPPAA